MTRTDNVAMIRVRAVLAIVGWVLISLGAYSAAPEILLLGAMAWAVGGELPQGDGEDEARS